MTTTMATSATPSISNYDGRIVEFSVTGVCNQKLRRVSSYTMKVPYNRMRQTMQEIHSIGGKIAGVNVFDGKAESKSESKAESKPKKEAKVTASAKKATSAKSAPKRGRRRKS